MKEILNESFVFHAEFIHYLPEENKTEWSNYIINYGLYGIEPVFENALVGELWRKIKTRIDDDKNAYEERKEKNRKKVEEWRKRNNVTNVTVTSGYKGLHEVTPYTDTQRVYDSDSVSDNDNVSVYEYEYDNVSDSVSDAPEHLGNNALSPILSNEEYPKIVYKLWKDAGLPCGDFTQWTMRDFKTALEYIHKNRYSSQEVITACENYIKELNDPDSYITNQMPFASFVKSKIFYNVLPTNYRHENFVKFLTKAEEKPYTGEMLKGVMYG